MIAEEVILLAISIFFCWRLKSYRPKMAHAFLGGLAVGIATLLWYWAAIAILVDLLLVFGVLKVFSRKIFWNIVFGFLTPLWLYLPYYLYLVILHHDFSILNFCILNFVFKYD